MPQVSAGLLMYRRSAGQLEVFLAHPGGPFWKNRDDGAWTIPKGLVSEGEEHFVAACREFQEETGIEPQGPFHPLGSVKQKGGKIIHAWGWEGNVDPACVVSNTTRVELPRGSGRWITVPEIDRCGWFDLPTARQKMNAAQAELLDRLQQLLAPPAS